MTIQDQSDVPHSGTLLTGGNGISLDTGGQILTGEGHIPKIRKPYTITKQRERWTEEEHKKFLEAIKLYGRAWRKIEGHVGTKTAIQIRSHAQKFFSKVVRESSNSNSSSIESIEIPPPRPKRKPNHPYPRKLLTSAKKEIPHQEQSARSMSPNSSVDQENQSPTSVLSRAPSDASGSAVWDILDGSSSPVSSPNILNHAAYLPSKDDSQFDEPVSMKLELSPKVNASGKEGSVEATSTKTLKLFGKTISVADSEKPSIPAMLPAVWYVNANSHSMEVAPPAPLPLWAFRGGVPFSFVPLSIVSLTKADIQDSGSNSVSVNASGSYDKNSDCETLV